MAGKPPLFAQLSHVYTTFTVAADNSFELLVPHRTTENDGTPGAPWLVSTSLWLRFLRHIPAAGSITLRDLKQQAALPANEFKMWTTRFESWWGYLHIDPQTKSIYPTAGGRVALSAFSQVLTETESEWRKRFGPTLSDTLKTLLAALEAEQPLPSCLSTLNYGMFTAPEPATKPGATSVREADGWDQSPLNASEDTLPVLLAKTLNAFALDYERETFLALTVSANILRLIPPHGIAMRDLPHLSGIAREACINTTKLLLKSGAIKRDGKAFLRTERGDDRNAIYEQAIKTIEARWRKQYGVELIDQLQQALPSEADLLAAIQPQPGNWRANVPPTKHLPYFPMILHRGGFPDGA
jgi:hypothetical protein